VQGLPEVVSKHAYNRCLEFLRDKGFPLPILRVRRDDEAFNRSHVVPLLAFDDRVPSRTDRRGLAILRFGVVDQLVV
jgi:hypothetical protein